MGERIHILAKETALYGVSTILGKFLNWMMVPLYTYVLKQTADYGIVTNLYSWTALLLVVLTYGMETGFLRFANKNKQEVAKVYSTTLISVATTSILFSLLCIVFRQSIANTIGYPHHPEWIAMLGTSVALDAFGCIPYVYLRFNNRPVRFITLNLLGIFMNIAFNIFFLVVCPWLQKHEPSLIEWFYNPDYGVGYVFISNLLSTTLITIVLLSEVFVVKFSFDKKLWKQMLRYSLPLVVLGMAGIMNQTIDKLLFLFLVPGQHGRSELGIYGATAKIALVIMILSQSFRNSYEPFIFAQKKEQNSLESYADAMKFYILIALLIFLGMVMYMDIFKLLIRSDYWEGLNVVPLIMVTYIFQGIFLNLSLWYKLTDRTIYGVWFSLLGLLVILILNIILVPKFSYLGCAIAAAAGYFVMMLASYFVGQRFMPIRYDFKNIGLYVGIVILLCGLSSLVHTSYQWINFLLKSLLWAIFCIILYKREESIRAITRISILQDKIT